MNLLNVRRQFKGFGSFLCKTFKEQDDSFYSRDSQLNFIENYKNLRCLGDSQLEIVKNATERISRLKAAQ